MHINDKPALLKAEILPFTVHGRPNHRFRTVCANDIICRHHMVRTVMAVADFDQFSTVGHFRHRGAAMQSHSLAGGNAAIQFRFQVGLMEPVAWIPSKRACLLRSWPVKQQLLIPIDKLGSDIDPRIATDALGKPNRLEDPHRLVVEMHSARQGIDRFFPFKNKHIQPVSGQDIGERCTSRAKADDYHLMMRLLGDS